MAVKKTEINLVAGLLESDAADTGTLAESIITALDEKRVLDDKLWAIVTQWDGIVTMRGPYPTQNKATKALSALVAPSGGMTAAVRQLRITP